MERVTGGGPFWELKTAFHFHSCLKRGPFEVVWAFFSRPAEYPLGAPSPTPCKRKFANLTTPASITPHKTKLEPPKITKKLSVEENLKKNPVPWSHGPRPHLPTNLTIRKNYLTGDRGVPSTPPIVPGPHLRVIVGSRRGGLRMGGGVRGV